MSGSRRIGRRRIDSRNARNATSAVLASSAGWNITAPAPIQRVAPLTSLPIPGRTTDRDSTIAAISSGSVNL